LVADAPATARPLPGNSRFQIRYRIHATGSARVLINQCYFPGWQVAIDAATVPDETLRSSLTTDGRLKLIVPAGATVEAFYDGPPGWRTRIVVIAVCTVAFVAMCLWLDRRLKGSTSSPGSK
jgi:hypothetical protein